MPPLKQKNVSDMCHSKIPGQGVVLNKQVYFLQLSMIYCSTNVQSVSQGKILFHQPLVKYPPGPFKSTLKTPLPTTSQKWKTVLSSNCYFSLNYPCQLQTTLNRNINLVSISQLLCFSQPSTCTNIQNSCILIFTIFANI